MHWVSKTHRNSWRVLLEAIDLVVGENWLRWLLEATKLDTKAAGIGSNKPHQMNDGLARSEAAGAIDADHARLCHSGICCWLLHRFFTEMMLLIYAGGVILTTLLTIPNWPLFNHHWLKCLDSIEAERHPKPQQLISSSKHYQKKFSKCNLTIYYCCKLLCEVTWNLNLIEYIGCFGRIN